MTLENTKAGDKIYCRSGWSRERISIETVDRVTKTTVIFRNTILKRDGYIRGDKGFNMTKYRPLTPEITKEYCLQVLRRRVESLLEKTKIDELNEKTLNRLIELLTPAEEQK